MKTPITEIPKCTNPSHYKLWLKIALTVPPGNAGFCGDCTPEFADKARKDKVCAHPEVMFRRDEDGFIEGYMPLSSLKRNLRVVNLKRQTEES